MTDRTFDRLLTAICIGLAALAASGIIEVFPV